MKKPNLQLIVTILTICFLAFSCDKENESELIEENGLSRDINDFMPQEIVDELEELGMIVNTGGNPPQIEGTFLISPYTLISSNIDSDDIGKVYGDLTLTFSNQKNKDLTIKTTKYQGSSYGESYGSFIVGDKNKFSVFAEIKNFKENGIDSSLTARVFTGTISDLGIVDFQTALVMLDDYGDPSDTYIEVGGCRLFEDSDGTSESTEEKSAITSTDQPSDIEK